MSKGRNWVIAEAIGLLLLLTVKRAAGSRWLQGRGSTVGAGRIFVCSPLPLSGCGAFAQSLRGLLLLCLLSVASLGATKISGDLPKELKREGSPYIVTSDIFVPAGKRVVIEEGVTFLFNNFTGLKVLGVISARSTPQRPIVFTSVHDGRYNPASTVRPNPYDWNGIYIENDALGSEFVNCYVGYSVFGIYSLSKFILVEKVFFNQNGRGNLYVDGKEFPTGNEWLNHTVSVKDATIDGVPVRILEDPLAPKRRRWRIASIATLIASAGAGTYFTISFMENNALLQDMGSIDDTKPTGIANLRDNESTLWQEQYTRTRIAQAGLISSVVLFAGGGLGLFYSFTF